MRRSNTCTLDFQCPDSFVYSKEELLFTMLRNLIDNAIKASPPTATVFICGALCDEGYRITVRDDGIGMREEDIEQALQPFYMADKSRARKQGGAGLGLSIVKRICDLHGSPLQIASKPQEGCSVTFLLEVISDEN
ncbi:MAG: sensor histidine kinase [Clostridium sp.]